MSYLLQLDAIIESGLLETEASSRPLFDDDICLQRMVNAGQLSELDKIQREKNEQFKQLLTAAEKILLQKFDTTREVKKKRRNPFERPYKRRGKEYDIHFFLILFVCSVLNYVIEENVIG